MLATTCGWIQLIAKGQCALRGCYIVCSGQFVANIEARPCRGQRYTQFSCRTRISASVGPSGKQTKRPALKIPVSPALVLFPSRKRYIYLRDLQVVLLCISTFPHALRYSTDFGQVLLLFMPLFKADYRVLLNQRLLPSVQEIFRQHHLSRTN